MRLLTFGTGNLVVGLLIWGVLFWPIAWPLALYTSPAVVVALVAAMMQAVALGVFLAYVTGAREALRVPLRDLSGGLGLLLAVAGLSLFTFLRADYGYIYQALDQPEWMRSDTTSYYGFFPLLNAFLFYCMALFLSMHLLVRNVEHGMAPKENYRQLGLWVALGAFLLAAVVLVGAGVRA